MGAAEYRSHKTRLDGRTFLADYTYDRNPMSCAAVANSVARFRKLPRRAAHQELVLHQRNTASLVCHLLQSLMTSSVKTKVQKTRNHHENGRERVTM